MAHPGKGLLVCLGVVAGCFTVVYTLLPAAPLPAKSLPIIPPEVADKPLPLPRKFKLFDLKLKGNTTGSLSTGENHRYLFHLVAGQFLEARVKQDPVPREQVDVRVRLFAPVGGEIFEIDSFSGTVGEEEVHLLAERTGWYQAEIDSSEKPGIYRIEVRAVRPASRRDEELARADKIFYLARETPLKDCRQALPKFLEAERIGKPLGRVRLRAEALMLTGNCLTRLGKPKEALPRRTEALRLYEELGEGGYQIVLLNSLGETYNQLGDV